MNNKVHWLHQFMMICSNYFIDSWVHKEDLEMVILTKLPAEDQKCFRQGFTKGDFNSFIPEFRKRYITTVLLSNLYLQNLSLIATNLPFRTEENFTTTWCDWFPSWPANKTSIELNWKFLRCLTKRKHWADVWKRSNTGITNRQQGTCAIELHQNCFESLKGKESHLQTMELREHKWLKIYFHFIEISQFEFCAESATQ